MHEIAKTNKKKCITLRPSWVCLCASARLVLATPVTPQKPFCRVMICLGETWTARMLTHTRIVWRVVTHNPFILFPLVFCYFESLVCAAMHSGRQQASRPAAGTRCSSPVLIGFAHAEIERGSATSGPAQPVGMEREMLPAFDNRLPASATSPCGSGI